MTRMLVLAGGFGTRLRSAVADVPKALAPIGATPFLYLQIKHWIAQGVDSFVFLLHHEADRIVRFLDDERELLKNCEVRSVIEPTPMDTGGAVAHAVRSLNLRGDFLLTNADTWLGTGVEELRRSDSPSIAVIEVRHAGRYGIVTFDGTSCVTAFSEKPTSEGRAWINAGLCHLHTDLVSNWDGKPFSLEKDLFLKLVDRRLLGVVKLHTDFVDIGIPEDYYRFCRWMEAGPKSKLCSSISS